MKPTPSQPAQFGKPEDSFPMRLNKYMSREGYSSRREADTLIAAGRVRINGRIAVLGDKVNEGDTVEVLSGREARDIRNLNNDPAASHAYYVFHKPAHTDSDAAVRAFKPDMFPVDALPKDIAGLIICSDDGRLARLVQDKGYPKTYRITFTEAVPASFSKILSLGARIKHDKLEMMQVATVQPDTLDITSQRTSLGSIKEVCSHFKLQIKKIERSAIWNWHSDTYAKGSFTQIAMPEELRR